jgi:mono/diheme cytochrome c family protein
MFSKIVKYASLVVIVALIFTFVAACGSKSTPTQSEGAGEIPKPSNAGGPGKAIDLTGDATAGATVFKDSCVECHGEEGKTGIANPGSDDGTVPSLNPIDPGLVSSDAKTFATNIDLFIEHGSTPEGDNPAKSMTAFGDQKKLTDQQIADVIAYVMSLNKK